MHERVVGALFADVVGSTALGERLDPELVADLVGDVVATVVLAVEENGGQVKDIAGDGVLALFDAPGDAGRAAVAIIDAISGGVAPGLNIRVGAAVGSVRSAELRGYAAKVRVVGPAITDAVSLEGRAEPGTALVSLDLVARTAGARSQASERAPSSAVLLGAADVVPPPPLPPRGARARTGSGTDAEHREERRTIVALFAAVEATSSSVDDVIADALVSGIEIVERFGGTLKDLAGDVIVALFGAPIAHEDDAERAILAGLALADALARAASITVRVGLASGRVVVGNVGAGHRVEYGAVGDAMNTAARLEANAEPGAVVAAEALCLEVEDRFVWADRREIAAKGKREPVAARRVESPARVAGMPVDATGGDGTFLMGRQAEADRLLVAVRERRGVLVVGDAGIGKTALIRFAASRRGWRRPWLALRGASWDQFRHLGALSPILDGRARPVGATRPDELEAIARVAVLDSLRESAADGVDALVVEDAHWIDEASLRVLADVAPETPMAIVVVTRSEARARFSLWEAETIDLGPLSPPVDAELLDHVVGKAVLPWDVEQRVLDAAAGNPLFLLGQVHALETAGSLERRDGRIVRFVPGSSPTVPTSIERLMTVRVDGLASADRVVVDALAVLGAPSSVALVSTVAGVAIDEVEARLRSPELSGLVSEVNATFDLTHSLVRETAYASMLKRDLRRLHRSAADALVHRDAGRGAWHRWHADQPSEAARLAAEAAREARARLSYQESAALFDLAGRAAEESGAPVGRTAELWFASGSSHLAAAALDEAMDAFARASALALEAGTATTVALAAIGYEDALFETRRLRSAVSDRGRRMLDEARALAGKLDDRTRARLLAAAGRERRFAGGLSEAASLTDEALALARSSGDASTLTYVLTAWRVTREAPGELALRSSTDEELVDAAVNAGDEELEFESRRMVLLDQLSAGRLTDAWDQIDRLVDLGTRLGERRLAWLAPTWRAMRLLATGPVGDAADAVAAMYEEGRRAAYNDVVAVHALQDYLVRRHQGRPGDAEPAFHRAAARAGDRWAAFWASLHVDLADPDAARSDLEKILSDPDLLLGGDRILGAAVALATNAVVALGDEGAAATFYERLLPWRGHHIVVGTGAAVLGPADHVLGRLAAVLGDEAAAVVHHHEAFELARRAGGAIAIGECALGLASWLRRTERVRLAEEARSIGEAVGSRRLVVLADAVTRARTSEEQW